MKDLETLLEEIGQHCRTGNRRSLRPALKEMAENRREYYRHGTEKGLLDAYSDSLYKALLMELDEEEEDSIEMAELAYVGLGSILKKETAARAEHYRRRLLLLHYFSDYFTDAIIELFLSGYRKDNMLQARNVALECLEKMQLSDMFYLEDHAPEMMESDEELNDACNSIETDPQLSDKEREESALLHKVLYAYLKAKYKN